MNIAASTMRIIPSIPAAIFTGAIMLPIFIRGRRYIEATFHSQVSSLIWAFLTVMLPVALACVDFRYIRERGWLNMRIGTSIPEDYQLCHIPTWLRMFVVFVSSVISILVLKHFHIEL